MSGNTSTTPIQTRAPHWKDINDEDWIDWQWQLKNRLNSVDELSQIVRLSASEVEALRVQHLFRVDITPYFASLINPDDPECPIRKQVVPSHQEVISFASLMSDPLAEEADSPTPGLVHRYPDRVLMLITTQCASYCRYCTRSRIVGDPSQNFSQKQIDAQIDYIERTPQIRDVLLSGGDPLLLSDKILNSILTRLRKIQHVEIIRIGSRIPVFLPMRITPELCEVLSNHHPLWLNIHVNHPKEITPELALVCDRLSRAGIPLGNQSVLLAGINDSVQIQRELSRSLVKLRVRPYYLYQCDLVQGAGHFRTPVSKGIEIIEGLRGHTSGYSVPTYVVDGPMGAGKIPIQPNYVLSQSPGKIVLRNYEGLITTYHEPLGYGADSLPQQNVGRGASTRSQREGISGLLEGRGMLIKPEGLD